MRLPPSLALPGAAVLAGAGALLLAAAARPDRQPFPAPPGYVVPSDSLIPAGPLGDAIRRGRAIMIATRDSLPGHAGNRLDCTNCHRGAGTLLSSGPWIGSYASFPQYNARAGRVIRIEDRVNECLRRSLNGTPLAPDGREMNDVVAYFAFLSTGIPHGPRAPWLGYRRLVLRAGDARAGGRLYSRACARCHGANGEGSAAAPPVWGPQSYAIGAGMARLGTAAAFIRWNMPFDRPGALTDRQAFDVAAFILSHPRPDTPGKEKDWPNGDAPEDAAYSTFAAHRPR